MNQVVIDNPVINSPFEEPKRHFRFDDNGITDEIVAGRRLRAGRPYTTTPPRRLLDYWTKNVTAQLLWKVFLLPI